MNDRRRTRNGSARRRVCLCRPEEPDIGDEEVGVKGPADGHKADAAQAGGGEGRIGAVRDKGGPGQADLRPCRAQGEAGAVALPGAGDVGRAQVEVVGLRRPGNGQGDA
jgi:hypothetical protein